MFRRKKTGFSSSSFSTDRSKAVLLLQFFFIGVSVGQVLYLQQGPFIVLTNSEDPDQTVRMRRLI